MEKNHIFSEISLKHVFENLFLFEFFVRNLQQNQREEYQKLLQLKEDIPKKVDSLHIYSRAKDEEIIFEVDDLIFIIFDCLQFNYDFEEHLRNSNLLAKITNDSSEISEELLNDILAIGKEFIDKTELNLEKRIYRYGDIAYSNNMFDVMHWWASNLDPEFRAEMRFDSIFNRTGIPLKKVDQSEETYTEINIFDFPFLFPNAINFKEENYEIFNSNEDFVQINSTKQQNSLVLTVAWDKPAHNIDEILEQFRTKFCFLQASSNWDLILSNICPDFDPPTIKPLAEIYKNRSKNIEPVIRYDSILKKLAGLCCYDKYLETNDLEEAADFVSDLTKKYYLKHKNNLQHNKNNGGSNLIYFKRLTSRSVTLYYNEVVLRISQWNRQIRNQY